MTSIISKTFEAQGHYQVVDYQPGQSDQFDWIMSLSRQVNGAIPLDVIPELGRLARVDAIIMTHQSTMAPVGGVIYRFESRTGAIIRDRLPPRHPPQSGDASGFTPVDIVFPSGKIRMQMLEASSIQCLWETQKEIESPSALRQMIEGVPAQRREE